ncbi:hypothetical protein SAMN04487907_101260 [Zunongwangia mangrovi]|uniref:Uncharacterized protein n=1 Tax=Zunongwangia mangrovi TaxID=1334022 RepID=A0A1I1DBW6_9FLAO|nr:hypothetical protein [Zunongwangia mangrovi]SFB72284.1 hypothetical protein SAMN04487907_101260 [Zunongwangia mangrovi]
MTTIHSNRIKYLSALAFLGEVTDKLSAGLRQDLASQRVRLLKHTAIVRKNATNASSTYPFIDENTKKLAGISTMNGNSLPQNMAVVADAISVGFAEGDGADKEGAVIYTQDVPAALRNANFVLKQNGREILDVPVADLIAGEMPTKQEDYFHDLETFILLADETAMSWDFVFPGGQTLAPSEAGKNVYVEVRIKGFKTLKNI